jgi:hypothetical protein
MKSIFKVLTSAFIICLVPFSMAYGQETKNEQKIKIIINDGKGEKIVIDTLLNNSRMADSLKLNNGNILYFKQSDDETDLNPQEVNKQVFITVSDDGKETRKVTKEIRIVNSDSVSNRMDKEGRRVYVYSDSEIPEGKPGEQHKVMHWSEKDSKGHVEKVIIINDRKSADCESGETTEHKVSHENRKSDNEKTKYIITRNGMVITIEGNDYIKVKELVKEIENKLDNNNVSSGNIKTDKEEQKRGSKKNK